MARTTLLPWLGQPPWTRFSAHRLRVHHRDDQEAKAKGPVCHGRGPMSGAGCLAPTTRSRQSRSRATRRRWTCRRGVPLADVFAKKAADTPKPPLRVARTVLALALTSLAKQATRWAAEAHVVLHAPGWDDTLAAPAPRRRAKVRPGQASRWLQPFTPSRFSQDSQGDPRSFRGHSLHIARVLNQGGRALDRPIVFCARCSLYLERADALCRSCR